LWKKVTGRGKTCWFLESQYRRPRQVCVTLRAKEFDYLVTWDSISITWVFESGPEKRLQLSQMTAESTGIQCTKTRGSTHLSLPG
jgi:hypothetical protein